MIKIAFFSSNPQETTPLQLDEEVRQIAEKLRRADYRNSLQMISIPAARPDDLLQGLNEHKPEIVHFSGHGRHGGELIMMDDARRSVIVGPEALYQIFKTFSSRVKLIFLNNCMSEAVAEFLSDVVDCVVSMNGNVSDRTSIVFAASFYRAIGFGVSIQEAFEQGVAGILLENVGESNLPVLKHRNDIDPTSIYLISQEELIYAQKSITVGNVVADEWINSAAMEFIPVSSGTYMMGSTDATFPDQLPIHAVTITKPFYIGKTVVTQQQWRTVVGSEPWKGMPYTKSGDEYPATYVSWEDAQLFIARLNAHAGNSYYRLPTEAEWEYCARAGSNGLFCFGNEKGMLNAYGWFKQNATSANEAYPHEVATKKPNSWGIFDMHGNVWEWVEDWYSAFTNENAFDPVGPQLGVSKVLRGGGFDYDAVGASSSFRNHDEPTRFNYVISFRVVRVAV